MVIKVRIKSKRNLNAYIVCIIGLILIFLSGYFFNKFYVLYEKKTNLNNINGSVDDFEKYYFAYYVNDNSTREMPNKDSGLTLDTEKSNCNNGVTVSWDDDNWHAILDYSTYVVNDTTRTKCTLYFKKKSVSAVTRLENLVTGANPSSNEVYTVPDKTSDSCTYTFAYDGTADNNLRYVGSNPCNYVTFNGEEAGWRIIGIMNNIDDGTGKKESRIKLIKAESIGDYLWDDTDSSVNYGRGINEWSQAKIMKLINPGYENESIGGSLYYNRGSGECYYDQNSSSAKYNVTNCDFTNSGLNENAKSLIEKAVWHTGSNGSTYKYTDISSVKSYELERSNNTGKICTSVYYCNDTVERTTTWLGEIGFIYPSDYGYATSGSTSTSRFTCLSGYLYNWNLTALKECKNTDWLYIKWKAYFTITPLAHETNAYHVYGVNGDGNITILDAERNIGVRPSVYLLSDVTILSGEGTKDSPYVLGLE